ncbi:MAG: hypothetical protein LBJ39_05895 [Tannerellaceae bacterium]|jgi:acyl-CoA thioesterase FadM|nr:hypothetical protein [Tannerellaceae bacterium]
MRKLQIVNIGKNTFAGISQTIVIGKKTFMRKHQIVNNGKKTFAGNLQVVVIDKKTFLSKFPKAPAEVYS